MKSLRIRFCSFGRNEIIKKHSQKLQIPYHYIFIYISQRLWLCNIDGGVKINSNCLFCYQIWPNDSPLFSELRADFLLWGGVGVGL